VENNVLEFLLKKEQSSLIQTKNGEKKKGKKKIPLHECLHSNVFKRKRISMGLSHLAELDDLADLLSAALLLDELNKLHDTVGNKLVADSLVLGEHLAELVKKVDDLLLGVGILDELLKSINDELADGALSTFVGRLVAELHVLTNLLGLHGLDQLDNLLKLTVKESSADVGVLGANKAAGVEDELLDLLVGLALIEPVVDERDNGLTSSALDGVSHGNSADGSEDKSDVDKLHFDC